MAASSTRFDVTEANIDKAFSEAIESKNNDLFDFYFDARHELEDMLKEYAEGKRICEKLFDLEITAFDDVTESDISDGSRCEISIRSKAVKKFKIGALNISVSSKWVDYIRSLCKFNETALLGINLHRANSFTLDQKKAISSNLCAKFKESVRAIYKPAITAKFPPKKYQYIESRWLKF